MANDREAAKKSITEEAQDDPELNETLSSAHKFQLDMQSMQNKHAIDTKKADLGFVGGIIGTTQNAATAVAFIAVLGGLSLSGYGAFSLHGGDAAQFGSDLVDKGLALSATAIAYLFGRGTAPKE